MKFISIRFKNKRVNLCTYIGSTCCTCVLPLQPSGYDGKLVSGRPFRVRGSNVHLFRVTRSWTGSVQMKSSMAFIRGNRNRCIERER